MEPASRASDVHPVITDTEELSTALLAQAVERLQQNGDVYPFAGYLKADRDIFVLHPPPEADVREIQPLLEGLAHQLRLAILQEPVLATALVCKARVKLPEQTHGETEAFCVTLDHRDGPVSACHTPFEAYFPFQVGAQGGVIVETPVLGESEMTVFRRQKA